MPVKTDRSRLAYLVNRDAGNYLLTTSSRNAGGGALGCRSEVSEQQESGGEASAQSAAFMGGMRIAQATRKRFKSARGWQGATSE